MKLGGSGFLKTGPATYELPKKGNSITIDPDDYEILELSRAVEGEQTRWYGIEGKQLIGIHQKVNFTDFGFSRAPDEWTIGFARSNTGKKVSVTIQRVYTYDPATSTLSDTTPAAPADPNAPASMDYTPIIVVLVLIGIVVVVYYGAREGWFSKLGGMFAKRAKALEG